MTNINFYCIEEDINQFLHTFLTNVVVENKKKVIIYSEHQEKIDKLNDILWTMKKTSFLPHLKIDDKGFEETQLSTEDAGMRRAGGGARRRSPEGLGRLQTHRRRPGDPGKHQAENRILSGRPICPDCVG